MARRVRPTLRCLRDDLVQAVPRADTPLDEIEPRCSSRLSGSSPAMRRLMSASRPSTTRFCSR
jgi:hypothetical protein